MAMSAMRIASRILSPTPAHARRCDPTVKDNIGDTLFSTFGSESKLIRNIGHEVGLA
jgi:hypothetical protein